MFDKCLANPWGPGVHTHGLEPSMEKRKLGDPITFREAATRRMFPGPCSASRPGGCTSRAASEPGGPHTGPVLCPFPTRLSGRGVGTMGRWVREVRGLLHLLH